MNDAPIAPDATEVFSAPDGFALRVDVFRARGRVHAPVIVDFHGGGWRAGGRDDHADLHRWFAAHGWMVVSPEYRFAPRTRFPAQLVDARAALAWAAGNAARWDGDGTRLVAMGHSAGGQLALLAAEEQPSPVRAVVTWASPIDLDIGWRVPPRPDPLDVRSMIGPYIGGTPDELPGPYGDASPIRQVHAGGPPTLLIQGVRDHAVLVARTREMAAALHAASVPAALIEIPWAEHGFEFVPGGLGLRLARDRVDEFLRRVFAAP